MDEFLHSVLSRFGYGGLERQLNEWNNAHDPLQHGTSFASAAAAAMLCAMQYSHTDMLCYYDAKLTAGAYGGFFAPLTYKPTATYQVFKAFGQLYALKNQVSCKMQDKVWAVAATDGVKKAVMVVNYAEEEKAIELSVGENFAVYLIDKEHAIERTDINAKSFVLQPNQVALVKND